MNFKKLLIVLSLLTPSIPLAANSYELYKKAITNCIDFEKSKIKLAKNDIEDLKPEDIEKFLFLIKDIRIQRCSSQEEITALIDELASTDVSINPKEIANRYLSIYNKQRISNLSDAEKVKLNKIDKSLKEKNLEINLLDLRKELKNN